MLRWIGVELERPLITQVPSRFDPWKDPLGVIAAYRLVKKEVPDVQLALVGSMALDDPEGWGMYRDIQQASRDDPDVHVFTNLTGLGNVEVNAFQRLSESSYRSHSARVSGWWCRRPWKGTPVVAGRAGGIPLQLQDGVGGFLVNSIESCAQADAMAAAPSGRGSCTGAPRGEHVRRALSCSTRLIADECGCTGRCYHGKLPRMALPHSWVWLERAAIRVGYAS